MQRLLVSLTCELLLALPCTVWYGALPRGAQEIGMPQAMTCNSGQVLVKSSTGTLACGAAALTNPMSALGDLLYQGDSSAPVRLGGNTTTTKQFLTQTGEGSKSAAPAWSTISASDLPTPTTSTLGGIKSIASTSHNWVSYIDTSGVPHQSQPAYTDLSGYPTLTNSTSQLSSDVTMTTANTFYDGPSLSLAAGTWLLNASVDLQTTSTSSAVNFTCKLWDGTNVASSGYTAIGATSSAAVKNVQMAINGIASLASTTTWKISCTSATASQLIKAAATNNSPGNSASTLVAVRIQ
jgi:hypothetical protein